MIEIEDKVRNPKFPLIEIEDKVRNLKIRELEIEDKVREITNPKITLVGEDKVSSTRVSNNPKIRISTYTDL